MILFIGLISFYVLLPFFFLIKKKKWIELVRKQSLSLEELKQQKKRVMIGGVFVCLVLCTYIIFRYKHYLSYPTPSYPFYVVTHTFSLLGMFYFPILYTLFITIPCIKEKEKEKEKEEEEIQKKNVTFAKKFFNH